MINLPYDQNSVSDVKQNAGIEMLRKKLEATLIAKHRELKEDGIKNDYVRCKARIKEIGANAIRRKQEEISWAEQDADDLKQRLDKALLEKRAMEEKNREIRDAANRLEDEIKRVIFDVERKCK